MTNPIVLISLDGLTERQFASVAERMKKKGLSNPNKQSTIHGAELLSPTALWGELLTSRPWYESGCYAQTQLTADLRRSQIISESKLECPLDIPNSDSTLSYSIPLIEKRERLWFGDGGFPSIKSVSDNITALLPTAKVFKGKPFSSAANAITNSVQAKHLILDVELSNLRILQSFLTLTRAPLQSVFIRFRAFDALAHLVGPHFLQEDTAYSAKIDELCGGIAQLVNTIQEFDSNAAVWMLSLFSHVRCNGRINLQNFLERMGIAVSRQNSQETLQREALAALNSKLAIQESQHLKAESLSLLKTQGNFVFYSKQPGEARSEDLKWFDEVSKRIEGEILHTIPQAKLIRFYRYDWWQEPSTNSKPFLYVHAPHFESTSDQTVVIDEITHSTTTHDNTGHLWSLDPSSDFPSELEACHVLRSIRDAC